MGKTLLPVIVLFLCALYLHHSGFRWFDSRPRATRLSTEIIDPAQGPVQENFVLEDQVVITKMVEGHPAHLTPRAHYKIAGRVVSKRHYHNSWQDKLSPVDLALGWGPMASDQYDEFISYRHSHRYYSYSYSHRFPHHANVIAFNSANEHLIPANRHIEKALKSIKVGEIIELEGLLVDVEGNGNKPEKVIFKTSLTREDKGAGACEVIYVTKVRIKNEVFE